MNPALVPVACGSALAIMAGAAATHWVSVRQTVALVRNLHEAPPAKANPVLPAPEDSGTREAKSLLAAVKSGTPPTPGPIPGDKAPAGTDARLQQVLTALENMVEINQELRNQVAETKRDLMELQFQVDTHSQSFRPLDATEEPSMGIDDGLGVLPPRQVWSE